MATWVLVALLAVDIALVTAAFRNPFRQSAASPISSGTATAVSSLPPVTVPATVQEATTTKPPATATATETESVFSVSGTVLGIVPVDSVRAWRFSQGACPGGGARLSSTDDGGRSWAEVLIPFSAITRVQVTDAAKVLIVGTAGTDCRESALRSTDTGRNWTPGGALALWYRSLATPTEIVSSSGRASTPCGNAQALSVSALSATAAAVLCESGKVLETADGAASWVEVARGIPAIAVDARVESSKLAALLAYSADGCSGLQISSAAAGAITKIGCVDLGGRSTDGLRTHVALSIEGTVGWLIIDADTYRSNDGGKTWSTP